MASQEENFRARAVIDVREDFERQSRDLLHGQALHFSAAWQLRKQEIASYATQRKEAIEHHKNDMATIDDREQKAAVELAKRHDSIGGRLAALTKKGRDRQAQERQDLTTRFDDQRMKRHRDLAALQERQAANEQKARLRFAMELKTMREDHIAARHKQRGWQDNNRPRLIEERATAHQKEAARAMQQDRPKTQEREDLSRAFNR